MKMKKNDVIKDIPTNLIPEYTAMGWAIYEEKDYKNLNVTSPKSKIQVSKIEQEQPLDNIEE